MEKLQFKDDDIGRFEELMQGVVMRSGKFILNPEQFKAIVETYQDNVSLLEKLVEANRILNKMVEGECRLLNRTTEKHNADMDVLLKALKIKAEA